MLYLLNPRVLIALALVALLGFSHFAAYRHGKGVVTNEWKASVAEANQEARRLEYARQSRVTEAVKSAAVRENANRASHIAARTELDRLRNLIATRRGGEESCTAANQRADTAEKLLIESGELLTELARAADAHAGDVKLLLEAWPK